MRLLSVEGGGLPVRLCIVEGQVSLGSEVNCQKILMMWADTHGELLNALKVNAFNFHNNSNIIPIVEMGKLRHGVVVTWH